MLVGSLPLALPPEMTIRTSTDVVRFSLFNPRSKSRKSCARALISVFRAQPDRVSTLSTSAHGPHKYTDKVEHRGAVFTRYTRYA